MQLLARAALCLFVASPFAAALAAGCSDSQQTGSTNNGTTLSTSTGTAAGGAGGTSSGSLSSGTAGAGSSVGGAGGASTTSTGSAGGGGFIPATCQGHVYACGDTVDNDGDGKIDWTDPDCLGPCDNTEDGFEIGIPGAEGQDCIQDCYWDNDSGSGNDDCHWNHRCDEHEMAPDYYPESYNGDTCAYNPNANTPGTGASCDDLYMTQSQTCYDVCGPLTPNGCDCFGCCELTGNPGNYVWLGSQDTNDMGKCDIAHLTDPMFCEPCKPVAACLNPCDICELCVGKPTLPPECYPPDGGTGTGGSGSDGGTPPPQCPQGDQPCGLPGQPSCPSGYYCITGCCVPVPP